MSTINHTVRANNPDSNNGRVLLASTYIGFVKSNQDVQRMGRLEVYIPEIGGDPQNPGDWIIVGYASMFAGATNPNAVRKDSKTMDGTQTSYGWWGVPPDLDNQVLVTFVNGDLARGFWFACIYQQDMNQMIPGIAAARSDDPQYKSPPPPTAEYNKANETNISDPTRAAFTPLAAGLKTEGLQADPARGPTKSSARRAAVSKVYGLLSPRGHQMYIDDDADSGEFIRLRTRSGTQVLINDTTGFVYINSKLGNAWAEISDDGVDIYAKGSISLRTEKDFNLRADNNILFDAGGSIFMRAVSDLNIQTGGAIVAGAAGSLVLSTSTRATLTVTGDFLTRVTGNLRSQSGADTTTYAVGNRIVEASGNISSLTKGGVHTRQASSIQDNPGSAPSAPAVASNPAQVPTPTEAPDIQDGQKTKLRTIVNRLVTHEPCGRKSSTSTDASTGTSASTSTSASTGTGSGAASASNEFGAVTAKGTALTTAQQQQNAQEFRDALKASAAKQGVSLSDANIDGIVANAYRESSMNPASHAIDSNGKPSAGLLQWNGDRNAAFTAYTGVTPQNASIQQQADYTVHELATSEKSTLNALQTVSDSSSGSSGVWIKGYERPANPTAGQATNLSYLPSLYGKA